MYLAMANTKPVSHHKSHECNSKYVAGFPFLVLSLNQVNYLYSVCLMINSLQLLDLILPNQKLLTINPYCFTLI